MSTEELTLRMQYNSDSVFVFEVDEGVRYEVVRWTKDELNQDPNLPQTVEEVQKMVENSPRGLIQKLYGTIRAWNETKENRKLD